MLKPLICIALLFGSGVAAQDTYTNEKFDVAFDFAPDITARLVIGDPDGALYYLTEHEDASVEFTINVDDGRSIAQYLERDRSYFSASDGFIPRTEELGTDWYRMDGVSVQPDDRITQYLRKMRTCDGRPITFGLSAQSSIEARKDMRDFIAYLIQSLRVAGCD